MTLRLIAMILDARSRKRMVKSEDLMLLLRKDMVQQEGSRRNSNILNC